MDSLSERVNSKRYELVHKEALNARILTEKAATVMLAVTAALATMLVVTLTDGIGFALGSIFVLVPTIVVGLMLLLAHRLGIAYAIIRELEGKSN